MAGTEDVEGLAEDVEADLTDVAASIQDLQEQIDLLEVALHGVNEGVLNMLENNCILTTPNGVAELGNVTSGIETCANYNSQYQKSTHCLFTETVLGGDVRVVACDLNVDNTMWAQAMCCSA